MSEHDLLTLLALANSRPAPLYHPASTPPPVMSPSLTEKLTSSYRPPRTSATDGPGLTESQSHLEADLLALLTKYNQPRGRDHPTFSLNPSQAAFTSTNRLAGPTDNHLSLETEAALVGKLAEVQDHVAKVSEEISAELREISLKLCAYAEIGFDEHKSHALLVGAMQKHGFHVTSHPSLPTAFIATFESPHTTGGNSKGKVIGINAEYDALRGLGQACGHNLIAITALGSAIAIKSSMEKFGIPGKVVLLGTPAEEGGGGKVIMLREGAYDDLDICLISHPGGAQISGGKAEDGAVPFGDGEGGSLACTGFEAEFIGQSAHAGAEPWMGVNALDAAVQAYSAVGMLRQQMKPDHRVHGILIPPTAGWSQNAIPDYCKVSFGVRAPDKTQLNLFYKRVLRCFTAAAEATGCHVKILENPNFFYYELRNDPTLAMAYVDIMTEQFGQRIETDISAKMTASTDFGNVCYKCPSANFNFAIPTSGPNGGNHTKSFADSAAKPEAHAAALKVLQGMSGTGLRYMLDNEFALRANASFAKFKKSVGEA